LLKYSTDFLAFVWTFEEIRKKGIGKREARKREIREKLNRNFI
jgi:hypothetical protein